MFVLLSGRLGAGFTAIALAMTESQAQVLKHVAASENASNLIDIVKVKPPGGQEPGVPQDFDLRAQLYFVLAPGADGTVSITGPFVRRDHAHDYVRSRGPGLWTVFGLVMRPGRYIVTESWTHFVESDTRESTIRFCYDRDSDCLVDAQIKRRGGWGLLDEDQLEDIQDHLGNANRDILNEPAENGLLELHEVPEWARSSIPRKLHLRLVMDVHYSPNGIAPARLEQFLRDSAAHATGEGLLTGDLPAEVDFWRANVFEVKDLLDEDEVADLMLRRIENGSLRVEDIPEKLARYGLMNPVEFSGEMRERLQSEQGG